MALIEFNDDVGGSHPWEVLNTQRSEVKTPYCKVVVYERPFYTVVKELRSELFCHLPVQVN